MTKRHLLCVVCAFAVAAGCSDSPSTAAPKVEGKPRPDWKSLSKEEKIAIINKQGIPEEAKKNAIERVNQGID